MNILGVEINFDFCDADQAEAYEREVKRVVDRVNNKKQYEGKSNADGIRIQCRIVDEFFDAVFGTGTADGLFHGKANLREHLEAFGAVSDAARQSTNGLRELAGRYAPNRAARRQEQKQQAKMEKKNGILRDAAVMYPEVFAPGPGKVGEVGPTGDRGEPGEPGPIGIPAANMATPASAEGGSMNPDQRAFLEKFIALMPEMDAFMKSYNGQQGNGANG